MRGEDLDARLVKARKTSLAWGGLAGAGAILAIGTFVFGAIPATIGLALVSLFAIWRYLGAADRVQHLEHQVEARNGTGAGQFWAGK